MYESNLQNVKSFLEAEGFNVYYVAIYGSQNYNLDLPDSDLDYKAIILPSLDDIISNSKPFSSVYEYEGGQIDVKDIRAYIDSAVKCNINFIEILNSKFYLGDSRIREFFLPLQQEMGQFYIKACYGMMMEKFQALRHPYPSTKDKIDKFGYDPKQLHHIARLGILIERFNYGDIGNFFHEGYQREVLLRIKRGEYENNIVDTVANIFISYAKKIRDSYTTPMVFTAKDSLIEFGRNVIRENIISNIK